LHIGRADAARSTASQVDRKAVPPPPSKFESISALSIGIIRRDREIS
jgi:hypothetical protein